MDADVRHEGHHGTRTVVAAGPGRIDAVLAAAFADLSRARVQRLIAAGLVTVNGLVVRKSGQVQHGDTLSLDVPETAHPIAPSDLSLPVLYEDETLVAIDKPSALAVHGAPGDTAPSVAGWFLSTFPAEARAFDAARPGVVHRLDKDTSGVLLLAKTPAAQAALGQAFESRATQKTYIAITRGAPHEDRALIDAAIARHPGDRTRMAIARRGGRESSTGFEVLHRTRDNALLVVKPVTGRTHQIRVHLAAIGAPVFDDRVYGHAGAGRQMLHAWRLVVPHPAGGSLEVTATLPPDMAAMVSAMGAESVALEFLAASGALRECSDAPPDWPRG
ncbi:MAG: RluA family pseudouridine synthase [Tepidiformaceae bacterium]